MESSYEMNKIIYNIIFFITFLNSVTSHNCPKQQIYAAEPSPNCVKPSDPNNLPKSKLENWFTKKMFNDLFPFANLGRGPHPCLPYSYESLMIAARYFPGFGTTPASSVFNENESYRRDVAAFFAHAVQETGANDYSLYQNSKGKDADDCFYRGGLFNWFEGGQHTPFIKTNVPNTRPKDGGTKCIGTAKYCSASTIYPCHKDACYFGRGVIQISYNYNYGQFQNWLKTRNVTANLLKNPNLIMTKMDPPLALMGSLWFYMTPQPPKPAMHDIVLGRWNPGYYGPIFGPTSLIINSECQGEDADNPGQGGENRRIKAFKWFCKYFKIRHEKNALLSCKEMPEHFSSIKHNLSYQPDWSSTWKDAPCKCKPELYPGPVPYFQPTFYPQEFVSQNKKNKILCEYLLYNKPQELGFNFTENCLKHKNSSKRLKKSKTIKKKLKH